MKTIAVVALCGLWAGVALAEDVKLAADNAKIVWTGTKPNGKHVGGFKKLAGKAVIADEPTDLKLDVEIDCASLYSDDPKLTAHLKSPDFFSVKEHPKAKFSITAVEKDDSGYRVTGDLTLLGKTKEISFPAEISVKGKLTLAADFKINRSDYGMTFGQGMVDDEVSISLRVATKAAKKKS